MVIDTRPTTKPTAIEAVRTELKRQILSFELPPGAHLLVDNLRREFDVSTATMREALSRLLIDNLVTTERQRGFRVRELSYDDFRNISEARKIIEVGALRSSLAHRDDNWEGNLFAAYRKLKLIEDRMLTEENLELATEWHQRNKVFHDCLVQNCRNSWLIDFRQLLHEHSNRYLRLALKNNRKHRDVRKEHAAIFESAIEGDVERCVNLIEAHIDTSVNDVAEYLPRSAEELVRTLDGESKKPAGTVSSG
ncbi:GntR family transcriptional regulator [Aquamicrobium sp. NLF2-7]|uniref:GntR family transcriptional regulator n=1 Tax=Aquamicrobium sp. NLF2-7 TaxID=2918753 RepID=UPI001EFB5F5A|nr:GntR family transcriptional regulator [Aquamicrobium sp. NLF2-7]MCG8274103.1 GntR family transcriptional regulator [Aquamicrobium sp. NLF2-7]